MRYFFERTGTPLRPLWLLSFALIAGQGLILTLVSVAGFVLMEAAVVVLGLAVEVVPIQNRFIVRLRRRSAARWILWGAGSVLWLLVTAYAFAVVPGSLIGYAR
jgi:hypothetical protein